MAATAHAINSPVPASESSLWRAMLLFLVPQTAGIALQLISSTITTVYFGRLIGAPALAVASTMFPIFFLLTSLLLGLFSGGVVLIGQAHGASDSNRVKAVTGTTLCIGGVISIAVMVLGCALARDILDLIGTPPDILLAAISYTRATFIALPVMAILFGYIVLLRGTGDALTPLWAMVLWIALSLMLIPAFIQGWFGWPGLGVLSAPYANLVASSIALLAVLFYLRRYRHPLAPDRAFFAALRVDRRIALRLFGIGIPAGLQLALVALSEVVLVSLVNAFGSKATAAYGVFNQVISYVQAPAQGAAVAASVFGAHAIGAGQPARLGAVARIAVLLSVVTGTIAIGAVYVCSANILSWFIVDPEPRSIAHDALKITLWSYLLAGVAGVLVGIMRSSGDVLYPTSVSILAIWTIQVPTAYLLSRQIGIDGVWIGYPVTFLIMLTAQIAYYRLRWCYRKHEQLT